LPDSPGRHRVVIVGAGFAGYNAAQELSKLAGASIEITVINSADYFLYLPLLPQVGTGLVEPRHICVSLLSRMLKVRFVLGTVTNVDPRQKVVTWSSPEGGSGQAGYDRLILTAGSVNKLLPIPGVADYAHGFRSIAEAIYLRDHIIRQLELAAGAADEAERRARCTFVVVGAGYTGTEVAAQGQLLTTRLAKRMPGLAGEQIRWMLLDTAPRLLPELDPRLSRTADRVLRRRGVEVRTGQSVATALDGCWVQLSTGEKVPTHSLIWCVGVRADPLMDGLNLDTNRGRLVVDEFMAVPGAPDIYACGDCAAVPDLTRPGEICGMTAQHAQRQGKQVARNVAASLGAGEARPYKHHDLGFLVDLGGLAAAANPLNIPLSGPAANLVTRAYHLIAMAGNRTRVLAEWGLNVIVPAEMTSFGLIGPGSVPLDPDQPRSLPGVAAPQSSRRRLAERGAEPGGGQRQRGRLVELRSLMPGAAQQLKPALGPGPDQGMMQGQALGGEDDMVPVAVRDQERRRASRHPRQQAQFPGPAGRVGDVRDTQQPGFEGERQQAGLHLGA
jgi:NADH:ubiquinone reductase (H+-translocating)